MTRRRRSRRGGPTPGGGAGALVAGRGHKNSLIFDRVKTLEENPSLQRTLDRLNRPDHISLKETKSITVLCETRLASSRLSIPTRIPRPDWITDDVFLEGPIIEPNPYRCSMAGFWLTPAPFASSAMPKDLGCGELRDDYLRFYTAWPADKFRELVAKVESSLPLQVACQITNYDGTLTYLTSLTVETCVNDARQRQWDFISGRRAIDGPAAEKVALRPALSDVPLANSAPPAFPQLLTEEPASQSPQLETLKRLIERGIISFSIGPALVSALPLKGTPPLGGSAVERLLGESRRGRIVFEVDGEHAGEEAGRVHFIPVLHERKIALVKISLPFERFRRTAERLIEFSRDFQVNATATLRYGNADVVGACKIASFEADFALFPKPQS